MTLLPPQAIHWTCKEAQSPRGGFLGNLATVLYGNADLGSVASATVQGHWVLLARPAVKYAENRDIDMSDAPSSAAPVVQLGLKLQCEPKPSSAYHPQTDGQTENANGTNCWRLNCHRLKMPPSTLRPAALCTTHPAGRRNAGRRRREFQAHQLGEPSSEVPNRQSARLGRGCQLHPETLTAPYNPSLGFISPSSWPFQVVGFLRVDHSRGRLNGRLSGL
ncbi:hypothetical protein EJ06DRAFT_23881 [Trichodelitschia bisporula]|uniref:Uncharacterized protein n=1 Tax=Trichodelitschia bisporula TaxID=703511 RepID=A0A6G1IB18_9PEZI|nr:hypothetical protein EJ06DRAFT_23881 [Trichodelitschia bisporula]